MAIFHVFEMRKTQFNVEILATFANEAKAKSYNSQTLKEDVNKKGPLKLKRLRYRKAILLKMSLFD